MFLAETSAIPCWMSDLISSSYNCFGKYFNLPKQLSEEEIQSLIQEGIAEVSAKSMQDMGKLMGYLKPQFEGKADMSIVSKLVKNLLA